MIWVLHEIAASICNDVATLKKESLRIGWNHIHMALPDVSPGAPTQKELTAEMLNMNQMGSRCVLMKARYLLK